MSSNKENIEKLKYINDVALNKLANRKLDNNSQARKVEFILLTVGFIFSGLAGLYASEILNKSNKHQIFILLLLISFCCVNAFEAYSRTRKEKDSPNIAGLIEEYNGGVSYYDLLIYSIPAIQNAEDELAETNSKISRRLDISFRTIYIILILMILFMAFPDLDIPML